LFRSSSCISRQNELATQFSYCYFARNEQGADMRWSERDIEGLGVMRGV
jgi:hypothetical protein